MLAYEEQSCKPELTVTWIKKNRSNITDKESITAPQEEVCNLLGLDSQETSFLKVIRQIPKEKGALLQKHLKHQFDFESYDYFIGCCENSQFSACPLNTFS